MYLFICLHFMNYHFHLSALQSFTNIEKVADLCLPILEQATWVVICFGHCHSLSLEQPPSYLQMGYLSSSYLFDKGKC